MKQGTPCHACGVAIFAHRFPACPVSTQAVIRTTLVSLRRMSERCGWPPQALGRLHRRANDEAPHRVLETGVWQTPSRQHGRLFAVGFHYVICPGQVARNCRGYLSVGLSAVASAVASEPVS